MSRRASRNAARRAGTWPVPLEEMRADDIIAAIRRKHFDGALATELVLKDEALVNRWMIDRAKLYKWTGPSSVESVLEQIGDAPIADAVDYSKGEPILYRRIDGLLYAKQKLIAIEVKISRADFKRDTEEKRRPWAAMSQQFVYATPKGLLDKSEIPKSCGLWEVEETGKVVSVKSAPVNKAPTPLPQQVFVAMMYRAQKAELAAKRK